MPELFTTLTDASDRREPRFRRAFVKAMKQIRASISMQELIRILETKNLQKAIQFVDGIDFESPLGPLKGISKDAFIKGGRSGAKVL